MLKRTIWPYLLGLTFMLGCEGMGDKKLEGGYPFEVLAAQNLLLPDIVSQYAGTRSTVVLANWRDALGEHAVYRLGEERKQQALRLVHAVRTKTADWRLVDRLVDYVPDCDSTTFEMFLSDITVTNAYKEEMGVCWIPYEMECKGNHTRKLILWADQKYGLRELPGQVARGDIEGEGKESLAAEAESYWKLVFGR